MNFSILDVSPQRHVPVLVFIHGGAFVLGSPENDGPDFLLNKADIVIVILYFVT